MRVPKWTRRDRDAIMDIVKVVLLVFLLVIIAKLTGLAR